MSLPFSLSNHSIFAAMYYSLPFDCEELPEQVLLTNSTTRAVFRPPSDFLTHRWTELHGKLKTESLERANLIFISDSSSAQPEILGSGHESLKYNVELFWMAFGLLGVRLDQPPCAIGGSVVDGKVGLRTTTWSKTLMRPEQFPSTGLTYRLLEQADLLHPRIRRSSGRVRHGLKLQQNAWTMVDGGERALSLLRSLEILTALPKAKGATEFAARCSVFFGDDPATTDQLERLYKLRNDLVHMNPNFTFDFTPSELPEEAALVEAKTGHLYTHILQNDTLKTIFESESDVANFWAMGHDERRKTFGPPLGMR